MELRWGTKLAWVQLARSIIEGDWSVIASILSMALLQASPSPPASSPPAPPPCDSEAHGGFDFWLGEWDVYPNGSDIKIAESRIERKYRGCAVVESWMPLPGNGGAGTSLNHLDPDTGRWHQKWVGSAPGAVEFEGGVVDGKMVLVGYWPNAAGPGQDGLTRMTYTSNDDGSVRQHGEQSLDHGLSWQVSFDFIYRAKPDQ